MREGGNIRETVALGADWIGMVFCPQSPRYVRMIPTGAGIIPDRGTLAEQCAATGFKRVGVFADDMAQNIITRAVNYNLDIIQMHGDEPPTLIRNLRTTLDPDIRPGIKFIKTIRISSPEDIGRYLDYEDCADYFLFCILRTGGRGGEWPAPHVLDRYDGRRPFLLGGGIGPEDAGWIRSICHPQFAGINISSRFETSPGVKDVEKLREFIGKLRGGSSTALPLVKHEV